MMAEQLDIFAPRPKTKRVVQWDAWSADPDGCRWYQREAVDGTLKFWSEGDRSVLLVMATGTGKTKTATAIAKNTTGRVLWMAHRSELIEQAAEELSRATGEYVAIEKAEEIASLKARVVVASLQTLNPERLKRWPKDHFELVIADEAHHIAAATYKRAFDWFEAPKKLGLTATPDRGDKRALGQVFDTVAYVFDILQGMEHGYLVPIEGKQVFLEQIDLSDVGKTGGDLVQSQLDEKIVKAVEGIVQETMRLAGDRRGPCFFPGVKSAELAAARFNALKPGCAAFVCGATPELERQQIIRDFRRGVTQWLCNCMIATEGFDDPTSNCIVVGRPTLSRNVYAQQVGRGLRPLAKVIDPWQSKSEDADRRRAVASSEKPNCLVLDFVGNSGKHDLVTPEDLLGGQYSDTELKKAKQIAAKAKSGDPQAHLAAARAELQKIAIGLKSKVSAKVVPFDPFKVVGIDWNEQDRNALEYGQKPATAGQLEFLRAQDVPVQSLNGLSKRAAGRVIDEIKARKTQGLASYKQLRQLQKYGITARDITTYQASKGMQYLAERAWGRNGVDGAELWRLVMGKDQ